MKLNEFLDTTGIDIKVKKKRAPRKDVVKKKLNILYDFVQRIIENTNRKDLIKKLERFFGNMAKVSPPYDASTFVPTVLQSKNFLKNLEFAKDSAKTILKEKPTDSVRISKHKTLADLLRKVKGTKFDDINQYFAKKVEVMERMNLMVEKYLKRM